MPNNRNNGAGAVTGIDVSHYQKTVDWDAVAQSGVKFSFIKATEGAATVDGLFRQNWQQAFAAGLARGAYHFFHPKISPNIQAELFINTVGELQPGDLPPILDLEAPDDWTYIPSANRAALALKWLQTVEAVLGMRPIVYLSPSFATEILKNSPLLAEFPLWIAHYTSAPTPAVPAPWKIWTFWQYSGTGRTAGISGAVDLNRFNGAADDLAALTLQPSAVHNE